MPTRRKMDRLYIYEGRIHSMRFCKEKHDLLCSVKMETEGEDIVQCESEISSDDDVSDNGNGEEILESCPVTDDLLKSVLARLHPSEDVEVMNFESHKAEELGRTNRVSTQRTQNWATKLYYKKCGGDTAVLNIVLKFLPPDPFEKYYVTDAGFDLREISFYTEVIRDLELFFKENNDSVNLELCIPKCLYTFYTDGNLGNDGSVLEAPESLLVVENLRVQGFTRANFSQGLDLEETECAIQAIAYIHGLLLAYKVKQKIDLKSKYKLFDIKKVTETYQVSVERGWPHIITFLEHTPCMENELQALCSVREYSQMLIENILMPQEPLAVFTHTDFWGNNLRFKRDSKESLKCKILDWQMVTYSRPSNDLALLLISSVKTEVRRENHDKLIQFYFENLSKVCAEFGLSLKNDLNYEYKHFLEEYNKSKLLALLLCVGCIDIALGDPVAEKRLIHVLIDLYNDGILNERCIS